jgi:hypothetical protein
MIDIPNESWGRTLKRFINSKRGKKLRFLKIAYCDDFHYFTGSLTEARPDDIFNTTLCKKVLTCMSQNNVILTNMERWLLTNE